MGGYYLMVARTSGTVPLALDFGSWVGGKKVEGPGARSALPQASQVDEKLGPKEVEESLSSWWVRLERSCKRWCRVRDTRLESMRLASRAIPIRRFVH